MILILVCVERSPDSDTYGIWRSCAGCWGSYKGGHWAGKQTFATTEASSIFHRLWNSEKTSYSIFQSYIRAISRKSWDYSNIILCWETSHTFDARCCKWIMILDYLFVLSFISQLSMISDRVSLELLESLSMSQLNKIELSTKKSKRWNEIISQVDRIPNGRTIGIH